MRLLGGIFRPSRNHVTCGRGKLAMRGAWMTAASPWDTLCCFSTSSKLPMSKKKQQQIFQLQEIIFLAFSYSGCRVGTPMSLIPKSRQIKLMGDQQPWEVGFVSHQTPSTILLSLLNIRALCVFLHLCRGCTNMLEHLWGVRTEQDAKLHRLFWVRRLGGIGEQNISI